MLHFKCIDYFTGKLKSVETLLTSVASVNDVNWLYVQKNIFL